ncbi:MAG TPA: trigger factor [Bacteroidia bacterium]|nr:trigger factor [Bacteroidia bacterium]
MNIQQEKIDSLNSILKVQLKPEDYSPQVDSAIKKYSKQVTMAGFRKGTVPVGLVRKMYGKSMLIDELNRIVADSLDKFIADNNIKVLGNPMPKADNNFEMNLDTPGDFEFAFELGVAPEVNLLLPPAKSFTYYEIEVDSKVIDDEIAKIQRRYGKYISPEVTDAECSVYGTFQELDEAGNIVEGGHTNQSFVLLDKITDSDVRPQFIDRKTLDVVTFNPVKSVKSAEEVKYMLGLKEGDLTAYDKNFRFTIERINKVENAELTTELFDQLYGADAVTDIAGFREKVKAEIAEGYRYESENALKHELEDFLLHETNMSLPDDFLKRWLMSANEKITEEQLAREYNQYARDLKWRLIENKIYTDNNMQINNEEIESYARSLIVDQYLRYGQAHLLDDERLGDLVKRYLSEQNNIQQVIENLTGRKVFEHLNQIVQKDVKKVTHDEFVDIMSKHHHDHH